MSHISSLDSLLISQNVSVKITVNTYQSAQKIIRIKHLHELSRGGLTFPSQSLREWFTQVFSILGGSLSLIRRSKVPSRKAGKRILMRCLDDCNVASAQHQEAVLENAINTVRNIFFNNQRKRKTERVVKDRSAASRKCKSDK